MMTHLMTRDTQKREERGGRGDERRRTTARDRRRRSTTHAAGGSVGPRRAFSALGNNLHQGGSNFACGANYKPPAPGTKGGLFCICVESGNLTRLDLQKSKRQIGVGFACVFFLFSFPFLLIQFFVLRFALALALHLHLACGASVCARPSRRRLPFASWPLVVVVTVSLPGHIILRTWRLG